MNQLPSLMIGDVRLRYKVNVIDETTSRYFVILSPPSIYSSTALSNSSIVPPALPDDTQSSNQLKAHLKIWYITQNDPPNPAHNPPHLFPLFRHVPQTPTPHLRIPSSTSTTRSSSFRTRLPAYSAHFQLYNTLSNSNVYW